MLDRLERDGDLLLETEAHVGQWQRSRPYAALWLHVNALLEEALPHADREYLTDVLLAALSPGVFHHQRHVRGLPLERIKTGFADLVARVVNA